MNHGNAATRLPQSYEDARRVQLLTAELRSPPARLMVVDTPAAVTITNELGQSRTVHPDGKQESIEIQGVPFGVTSRRDGDQLIVVYRVDHAPRGHRRQRAHRSRGGGWAQRRTSTSA